MAFGTGTVFTNIGKAYVVSTIIANTTPPKFIAIGTGATTAARTAANTDTALSSEYGAPGSRTTGTASIQTVTYTGDTFQTVGTVTALGTIAVDEAGLFTSGTSNAASSLVVSATFPVINLLVNDSIQITGKITFS